MSFLLPFLNLLLLGPPLIFMLIYLWSRANTSANVSIMGMVSVKVRAFSLAGTPTISHAISESFFTLLFPASVLADLDRRTVLASEAQQRCRHMLDQSIAKSLCSKNVLYRLDLSMKHSWILQTGPVFTMGDAGSRCELPKKSLAHAFQTWSFLRLSYVSSFRDLHNVPPSSFEHFKHA